MLKDLRRRKKWRKLIRQTKNEKYSYNYSLIVLKASLEDLLDEAFDYMFVPEIEVMCFEIIETISNINLMVQTESEEEYDMLKHRLIYMITNKLENWYI